MRIKLYTGVFMLLLLNVIAGNAQNWRTIYLPDSIELIDIVADDEGFIYLSSRNAFFILNNGTPEKLVNFKHSISEHHKPHSKQSSIIYPGANYGFSELHLPDNYQFHRLSNGDQYILNRSQQGYQLIGDKFYFYQENKWNSLEKDFGDKPWFVIENAGACYFINEESCLQFRSEEGIDTLQANIALDNLQAVSNYNNEIYLCTSDSLHKLRILQNSLRLEMSIPLDFQNPVIDLAIDNDAIVLMTANEIVEINRATNESQRIALELEEFEEWRAVEIDAFGQLWLASNQRICNYADIYTKLARLENFNADDSHFYTIRENDYISNGEMVLKYDKTSQTWFHDKSKAAAQKIVTPPDGHPILIFEDYLLRIHKVNALILDYYEYKLEAPIIDAIKHNDQLLLATSNQIVSLPQNTVLDSTSFPNKIIAFDSDSSGDWLITNNAVFRIKESRLHLHSESTINANQSAFLSDGHLLSLNAQQAMISDLNTSEEQLLANADSSFIDFYIAEDSLYLLTSENLLTYTPANVGNSEYAFETSIPLPFPIELGKIVKVADSKALILTENNLIETHTHGNRASNKQKLRLIKDESNNTLRVVHTNHWTDKTRFNFIFFGKKNNEAIWTNSNVLELDESHNDYNSVKVIMTEPFSGDQASSNAIQLSSAPKINYPYYIIVTILIFASGFWGSRLLKA